MPREKLTKTKFPNIYKTDTNKFYFRKKINDKIVVRSLGKDISVKEAFLLSNDLEKILLYDDVKINKDKPKTLKDLIDEYISIKQNLYSDNWKYIQLYNFKKLEKFYSYKIGNITSYDIQSEVNKLLKTQAPATVEKLKNSLSALFNHYNLSNIAKDVNIPKYDNKTNFSLTDEEINKLKNAILSYHDLTLRCFFMFGLHGRRKGEISNLRWSDIDFEKTVVNIKYCISKNRKNMTYPIMEYLLIDLKKLKDLNNPKLSDYLFTSSSGKPLYWIQKPWKRLCIDVGIENMRFHDLRHLIGFIAINKNISLEQIAATLGHSNIKTTMRYSKLKETTARNVLSKLF